MNENATSTAPPVEKKTTSRDWRDIYAGRLVITDLLVLIWVVFGVQILWFGLDTADLAFRGSTLGLSLNYTAVSIILIAGWMTMLGIYGSRGYRVLGTGPDEYKLIASSSLRLFGLLAIVAYLFHIDVARGYILIAFPMGIVVLIFSRWMWRQWLVVQRQRGHYTSRVVLLGSKSSAVRTYRELVRQPGAGYLVVGACVPAGRLGELLEATRVPILGDLDDAIAALDSVEGDTIVVTSSSEIAPTRMRELGWSLEPGNHHLVVAPSLTDIGGPRIHTRPVAGLPLIHVETPRYEGRTLFAKRLFDLLLSSLLILFLSPLLAGIALVILSSRTGSIFFRQYRIGINGELFQMLKFRSMVVDAESQRAELIEQQGDEGNRVLFKLKDDPRITRVGRLLRRFSLDELPQLFNVFGGSMSLVGPRPSLESEVESYERHVHRRFLVKPGITGLWQISGRSNLSWNDTVRLDLYYVENWSIAGDLIILWRTARAVLRQDGAY